MVASVLTTAQESESDTRTKPRLSSDEHKQLYIFSFTSHAVYITGIMASISDDGMVLSGYQKKLKTMKKKFFVLYEETCNATARLEYYDTEKKFLQKAEPKRIIYLKNCFNINRRLDTKHRYVIVLSSREGGFGIVLESENDLRKWLDKLLFLQRNIANTNGQVFSTYGTLLL